MIARMLLLVVLGVGLVARAAEEAAEVDWGTWRVKLEEREQWARSEANSDPWAKLPAGIGLWRQQSWTVIADYETGWMAQGDEGYGVTGLLAGEVGLEERLEIRKFGRRGSEIQLIMVVRATGGVLPESVKAGIRRMKGLPEDSRVPVTFDDARSVKLRGRKVLFAGGFPDDLPVGDYRVVVELRDEAGTVEERYEKRLVRRTKAPEPLSALTDEQLIREYVRRGEAIRGSVAEPLDSPVGRVSVGHAYESPAHTTWQATHREIVRRGGSIVPAAMALLEAEAVRNPGEATFMDAKFGLAFDVMRMLEEINDPRAVEVLARVMEGMRGKANRMVREQALETATKLSYVAFVIDGNKRMEQAMVSDGALVASAGELPGDVDVRLRKASRLYVQWIRDNGTDRANWLALAQQRARKALAGDNPVSVRNAIEFLAGRYPGCGGHDDAPDQTILAIARLLDHGARRGQEQDDTDSYLMAISNYGPTARPYVDRMISQARTNEDFALGDLARVGGEKAMAYMMGVLPELRDRVKGFGVELDVDDKWMNDAEASRALHAYQTCRWGIERWAGRTFGGDQEIAGWWEKAKGNSQRQWLEENLERTSGEADGGSAKAQYIIRCVLPDLPHAEDDRLFELPWLGREELAYREKSPGAYRQRWLRENRATLKYDERKSCFVQRGGG